MQKAILALSAIAVLFGGAANAAEMPVKAKPPMRTWDGWYAGGNVGYSWGRWDSVCPLRTNCFPVGDGNTVINGGVLTIGTGLAAAAAALPGGFTNTARPNVDGWLGGIQGGRNWQRDNWVIGFEADLDLTAERAKRDGSVTFTFITADNTRFAVSQAVTNDWKFLWFSTVRGRLGWANDTWLAYVTGGLAIGGFKYSHSTITSLSSTTLAGVVTTVSTGATLHDTETRLGFSVGAGFEKMITKNWIGRLEYLYLDFGTHRFLDGATVPTTGGVRYDTDVRLRDHILRVGLSYKFDPWIVAKY